MTQGLKKQVRLALALTLLMAFASCLNTKMNDNYSLTAGDIHTYEFGIRIDYKPKVKSSNREYKAYLKQAFKSVSASIHGTMIMDIRQLNSDGTADINLKISDLEIQVLEDKREAFLSAFEAALDNTIIRIKLDPMGGMEIVDSPTLPDKGSYNNLSFTWNQMLEHLFTPLLPGRLKEGRTWDQDYETAVSSPDEDVSGEISMNQFASFKVASVEDRGGHQIATIATTIEASDSQVIEDGVTMTLDLKGSGKTLFDTDAGWFTGRETEYTYREDYDINVAIPGAFGSYQYLTAEIRTTLTYTMALKAVS